MGIRILVEFSEKMRVSGRFWRNLMGFYGNQGVSVGFLENVWISGRFR